MKFGKYLLEQVHAPWREHYIDYAMLKRLVYETAETAEQGACALEAGARARLLGPDVERFMTALDGEIERVSAFYARMAGELRGQLVCLAAEQQAHGASEPLVEALRDVGRTAVLLVQFLELNVTALRKILKKHEKRVAAGQVAARYLASRRVKESALERLHSQAEVRARELRRGRGGAAGGLAGAAIAAAGESGDRGGARYGVSPLARTWDGVRGAGGGLARGSAAAAARGPARSDGEGARAAVSARARPLVRTRAGAGPTGPHATHTCAGAG